MNSIPLLTTVLACGSLVSVAAGLLLALRERLHFEGGGRDVWGSLVNTDQFRGIVHDLTSSLSAERETLEKLHSIVAPRGYRDNYISEEARLEIAEHIELLMKHLETQSKATERLESAVSRTI
jgi:hypothetical protein